MAGMKMQETGMQYEVPRSQEVVSWEGKSELEHPKAESVEVADSNLLKQYIARCQREAGTVQDAKPSPESVFAEFGFHEQDFLKAGDIVEQRDQPDINETLINEAKELYKDTPANCYYFAFGWPPEDIKDWPDKPQPGQLALSHGLDGHYDPRKFSEMLSHASPEALKDYIVDLCKEDCQVYGKELKEVDQDYQPKDGERVIALMSHKKDGPFDIDDYHFMVKGENGTYLHKPGLGLITDLDNSGNLIRDPAHCDTIYETFLGYFVLSDKED